MERREAERYRVDGESLVDFVSISEKCLDCTEGAFDANVVDISTKGIGLRVINKVSEDVLYDLITEKKKLRLNFTIEPETKVIKTFATLARRTNDPHFFGLAFQGITEEAVADIEKVIEN
ncbi:MAG: PilZ domain-containing protein [Candidatus Anammoxibacter sp.]